MAIPEFDIFSESDTGVRWIESVSNLATAKARLEKLAADNPGKYFAFSSMTHSVVARVDSTAKMFKYVRPQPKAKDAA